MLQAARWAWAAGAQKQARQAEEPSPSGLLGASGPPPAGSSPQAEHGKSDVRIPVLAKNVADLHLLESREAQGAGPGSPPQVSLSALGPRPPSPDPHNVALAPSSGGLTLALST